MVEAGYFVECGDTMPNKLSIADADELEQTEFSEKLAYYSSELNALHPFREGNGRTTRLFLDLLCNNAGY